MLYDLCVLPLHKTIINKIKIILHLFLVTISRSEMFILLDQGHTA